MRNHELVTKHAKLLHLNWPVSALVWGVIPDVRQKTIPHMQTHCPHWADTNQQIFVVVFLCLDATALGQGV